MQIIVEAQDPLYETKTNTPTVIDGTDVYYSNTAFPDTGLELLTINYYDNYDFDLAGGVAEDAYGVSPTAKTKTLATGSKVRVMETDHWITTVTYYDKKARPIYSYTKNPYLNTIDKIKYKVDFTGKVLETTTIHTKDGQADITSIDKFSYDRMGRLLKHSHQIAGQPGEVLAENVYDELGQLIQKKTGNHSAAPLQTVDYSYNIRGWLTGINDVNDLQKDLFGFHIRYNDPLNGATALYNGNISETHWRTSNTDNSLKSYTYSYDALNRITGAIDNTGNYNLNAVTYDKNGNILSLSRQGHTNEAASQFGLMDELVYSYDSGNKLLKVEDIADDTFGFKDDAVNEADNSEDYTYDVNGNMLSDTNKGITGIAYNHLNLPTRITINGQDILYIYDAAGIKQQKVADGTTTDYAGGYIYENGSLKFVNHTEGYIEPDGAGGYEYVYQYTDHLGNVRLSYADANGDGVVEASEIRSEKNYYPFGLLQRGYNNQTQGTYYPYGFNGKEENDELDLKWLDFGARNYDAALGRWMNIDPLAEDMRRHSPYNYAFDNPIYFIDPDGRAPTDEWNKNADGSLTWVSDKGGDTTDYVNNLDQDGNVVSTDVYEVETTSEVSSTQEVDLNVKLPGIRHTIEAGVAPGIESMSILDVVSEVADIVFTAVGEELGVNSTVLAAATIVMNPKKAIKKAGKTSRAARREAMRKGGIPTSQQPKSQSKNASGREYSYDVPREGGGTQIKSVQQQTMDRSHKGQPHWEAGSVKMDNGTAQYNNYGRSKLKSNKSKVDYDD